MSTFEYLIKGFKSVLACRPLIALSSPVTVVVMVSVFVGAVVVTVMTVVVELVVVTARGVTVVIGVTVTSTFLVRVMVRA